MRDTLYKLLEGVSTDVTMIQIIERLSIALVLGLVLYITYMLSFSSVTYNSKFNTSLIMIAMVTTAVMMVIGSSVALSLGMVGALSIVRFRTAIKDPRDAAYIFWSIAIGLCAGTGNFVLGMGTTLGISLVLLIAGLGLRLNKDHYIVIIRGDRAEEDHIMSELNKTFKMYALKSKHTTENSIELVYQVKMKNGDDLGLVANLYKLSGMKSVNILAQSGESVG